VTPERSERVRVEASADRVYDLISGLGFTRWSPEATEATWEPGAPAGSVGARFRGRNRRGLARWATTCEVIAAEPGTEFTFVVGSPAAPQTTWRYRITADGDGCEVEESFTLGRPLRTVDRIVTALTTGVRRREADLDAGMRATLAGLKAEAEAEP
jgi:hypothetical protein